MPTKQLGLDDKKIHDMNFAEFSLMSLYNYFAQKYSQDDVQW